jgi:hypothetical protein
MARHKKVPKAPEPRVKREPVSNNLLGMPCEHTFQRYRGYMMCSQPLCAALQTLDGYALTKEQMRALIQQLRSEGLDII